MKTTLTRSPNSLSSSALDEAIRRGIDLLSAIVGLCLLGPVVLVLAVLVKLDSPGPVFYGATRIGHGGRPFTMLKFRTMVVGADRGAGITGAADARITRLGRRLRAWRLDELPQLFNVLRGDMSLVGPRPEAPRYVALYSAEQRAILSVRPGITGPTQLRFRNEAALLTGPDVDAQYIAEILPAKLASDLDYVRQRTIWSDLKIMGETLRVALRGERGLG